MTYTNGQIRAAILKTAKLFEDKPQLWNFGNIFVPDCGTPGCALGYIGHFLHMERRTCVTDVSIRAGFRPSETRYEIAEPFYNALSEFKSAWYFSSKDAVFALRAYADKYFPAEQLDPAFVKFRQGFVASVEAA